MVESTLSVRTPIPAEHHFETTRLWQVKQSLQFTGWLQYLPNLMLVLVLLAVAGAARLVAGQPGLLVQVALALAALLSLVLAFDVATIRLGLHPAEALPRPRTELDPFELMRSRRSCRSFQARSLTENHRAALLRSVGEHSQPERQLGRRPIRFEYVAAPLTVWPVVGAHEFLVAIAPRQYDRLAVIDVGRSLQKIVLDATRMGLATCWIGPGADQTSAARHLGERFDPAIDHIICVCAVGYRSRFKPTTLRLMQRSQRWRYPLSKLFFADPQFTTPLDTDVEPFNTFGRCYEVCQWSPSSYNSQTTRCIAVTQPVNGRQRLIRFDFCAAIASRYYAAVALGIWCANWETGCAALGQPGHFSILSPEQRAVADPPPLPRYDVSWIVDEPATGDALATS